MRRTGAGAMMSSQLGRTLLSRRSLSADQQDATTDETGSYGELMDAIDRIREPAQAEARDRSLSNAVVDHPSLPEEE
ncbi:MAG TPA: hypothetical protein VGL18_13465 [Actinomycetota bacterium]